MSARDTILDVLCPMHAVLGASGHITAAGPTLCKLCPDLTLPGMRFLELVEVSRPRGITGMEGLLAHAGRKLHLRLRGGARTALKGVLVPDGQGGAVIDLSFGISVVEAVRDYRLTSADFAATDLTVEMLYLIEAQSAAMGEHSKLNARLQGARIAAEEQAFTDTLTGLRNRRALDQALGRCCAGGRPFALMQLDLDFFKAVNDTLGHAAGDFVLQKVAAILASETREEDLAARVGGDEFLILLPDTTDRKHLADIAARIITRLERPMRFDGQPCRISGSIGIAVAPAAGQIAPGRVMAEADAALYASKHAGRGRYSFYTRGAALAPGAAPAAE